MEFSKDQIELLKAPLSASNVKQREQSGNKLSYIEAWHAIAEANRIFGFDAWDRETVEARCVSERERKIGKGQWQKDGWGVTYTCRVRIRVGTITREGCGAGHGIDADLGMAHESALKEAESDAMKRAFMTFGNPFGLALYDKTQANVEHDDQPAQQKQPANDAPKPISAAEQKRQLLEIDRELLDCHSPVAVETCASTWKHIATRDGWSRDYKVAAAEKFAARRAQLLSQEDTVSDIQNTFGGAKVVNETIRVLREEASLVDTF